MKKLIIISLLVNITVLIPICMGLAINAEWIATAYGGATTARGILLSIYISILAASVLLFIERAPRPVAALLLVQILYKFTTPFTVGTLENPVVISNLVIAVIHSITLFSIYQNVGNPFRKEDSR